MAVGMAIAERHLNADFGDDLVDHRTWVIAGDGCLMEGINHEAIGLAGHLGLGRLNVLWDDNQITIDGATDLSTSRGYPGALRAPSAGTSSRCDGHDFADIRRALDEALADPRPSLIACRTIIGKGAPNKQGTVGHPRRARSARTRSPRRASELGWDASRRSRFPTTIARGLARGRRARRRARMRDWQRAARTRSADGAEFIAPHGGRPARRLLARRLSRRPARQAAEGRDPQGVRTGARRDQRRSCPRRSAARPT